MRRKLSQHHGNEQGQAKAGTMTHGETSPK